MNYILKNKIEKIIDFDAKHYFAIKEGKIYNIETNQVIDGIENQRSIHSFGDNHIITINSNDGSTFIIDVGNFNIDNRFKIDAFIYPYLSFYQFEGRELEGIYKYKSQKILFETTEWIGRDIIDNYIFSDYHNIITNRDIYSGKPFWQFDLNQFDTFRYGGDDLKYEVVQFIGIWQNILLVQLKNARIIALDIYTGELLHDLEINMTKPLSKGYYDAYIKMHLVDNRIIWLTNQILLYIDLNTFIITIINEFYTQPKAEQWRFMHNTYFEDKLYFIADYAWQYVTPSYIGVMDTETGEILWSEQLKNTSGLPEAPQVTDKELFIRTNKSDLYIFERQAPASTQFEFIPNP